MIEPVSAAAAAHRMPNHPGGSVKDGLAPIGEHPARGFTITQPTAPGGRDQTWM